MANKIITINRWDGGIVADPRDTRENVCRVSSNFDIFFNPSRLIPLVDTESGDSSASTSKKRNFAIALRTGTTYSLYGLGVQSGAADAEILYKDLTANGSNDLSDAGWANTTNNQQTTGTTTAFDLFVFYRKTGLIYGARDSSHVWTYDPSGGGFTDSHRAITHTQIRQGLVHQKDDILYIPYYNSGGSAGARSFIAKNDNGSWTNAALTLPDDLIPNSIAAYGNHLAIGCAPFSRNAGGFEVGKSVVYLWDRDASLATLSESIDWGEGVLEVLEELDGVLLGISQVRYTAATPYLTGRLIVRAYDGRGAVEVLNLEGDISILRAKQKVNNRLYFAGTMQINGVYYGGLFSIRRTPTGFALAHEANANNDTSIGLDSGGAIRGFFIAGDYKLIAHENSANTYGLNKTIEVAGAAYTTTSIRETQINPGMTGIDRYLKKRLVSVALTYAPLPAAGQVVLKYKVDGGSNTTIFTETTDNATITEKRVDTNGAQFTDGREYEFRIESTGNAQVTGLIYQYEVLENILT